VYGGQPITDRDVITRPHVHLETNAQVGLLIHVCAPTAQHDDPFPQYARQHLNDHADPLGNHVERVLRSHESGRRVDNARVSALSLHQPDQPFQRGP